MIRGESAGLYQQKIAAGSLLKRRRRRRRLSMYIVADLEASSSSESVVYRNGNNVSDLVSGQKQFVIVTVKSL